MSAGSMHASQRVSRCPRMRRRQRMESRLGMTATGPSSPGGRVGVCSDEETAEHPGGLLVDLEALREQIRRGFVLGVLDDGEDGAGSAGR